MEPLALYVHIPFCVQKCGYCDFNAYAGMDRLKPAYHRAILAELDGWAEVLRARTLTSVSFGGGTPGESAPADLVAILDRARGLEGDSDRQAEISLEANPGTISLEALAALVDGGFNRISLGAQSFDPVELRFLDRVHSPEAIGASVANARRAGFRSIGLDLMYGLPGQSGQSWRTNVERGLALGIDHVSCYALTVEEGTPLEFAVRRGEVDTPDADLAADMYEAAELLLADAGFRHYEISNWARPGHESRHNLVYWRGGDYLGVGAGAHGFLSGERYENTAHPRAYVERAAAGGPFAATCDRYVPPRATAMLDWLETHLRLLDGFSLADFTESFAETLEAVAGPVIADCETLGLLEPALVDGAPGLRLTPRGRLLHSEVCARLLARLQPAGA
jgi:oxygen-independent coproporphyrinogen-3 oxidase